MRKLLAVPVLLFAQSTWSAPFDSCPAQAFLTQGSRSQTYAVDLLTGDYRMLAEDMKTIKSINGLGFNPQDKYIYGWSYEFGRPARVHSDFSIEALNVDNISFANFYVGDVHPTNNHYYVYRKGASYGLYRVQLDETAPDYLEMTRVIDGASLSMRVADMAINPADDFGYAVSSTGELFQIDLETGAGSVLSNVGQSGGFGAAYFDPEGNLYIGRNNDGSIFRIAIGTGSYTAELFASGPSSNINDGSRCATAPVSGTTVTNIDFGDAPDSYGSYLDSNGARHGLDRDPGMYLGSAVDSESESSAYPLSDDDNDTADDEDGIQFATSIVDGTMAVIMVKSSGSGYLNGWIDFDSDGAFNGYDQIIYDLPITSENQAVYVEIPDGAVPGKTWSRFRLSSQTGLEPTGGAPDGEVEDYALEIQEQDVTVNHYPSANGWTTVAFEDNWPLEGDYDMNDLVVYLRTAVAQNNRGVKQVGISGEIAAVGAAYHNGFAVRLPGIKYADVNHDEVRFTVNGQSVSWAPMETGRDEAILMVSYNLWDYVGTGEHCLFYRTENGCGSSIQMKFEAQIPMLEPVRAVLPGVMNPFLFATPGAWHGGHFFTAPGRGYEVHLKNQEPTEAFNISLFDQPGDDASDISNGSYFQTQNGLPWALEIGTRWEYPIEYHDISHAYPLFATYAESSGLQSSHWYASDATNRTFIFEN